MKQIATFLALVASVSFILAEPFDPKACHRRCMEIRDDKQLCDHICYGKKDSSTRSRDNAASSPKSAASQERM